MLKKVISFILVLCLVFSTFTSVLADGFLDMPLESYWSYKALNEAVANGLIKGYNNQINPKSYVTRAQIATILNRAFGAIETENLKDYSDVSDNAWYATDMAKAVKMGTFKGDSSKKLSPLANATRQETFVVLARALKLGASDVTYLDKFSDNNDVAAWAKADIASLVNAGYVNGSNGKLNPKNKITLEEFAQLMSNIISHYISKSGTYTEVGNGNVMINTTDVTLKDVNVNGDLIVGEGAANSDITLDNVVIKGRLIVRGGGENSIKLVNKSNVGSVVIGKTASGAIRLKTEEGCKIDLVYIDDGNDDVIVEGVFNQVIVSSPTPVVFNNADVTVVSVAVKGAAVTIEGASNIKTAEIQQGAVSTTITVSKGATVQKLNSDADNIVVEGEGKVVEATVSGNNIEVNTKDTELTVKEGATGVVQNGNPVEGTGEPIKTGEPTPTPTPTPTPDPDPTPDPEPGNAYTEVRTSAEFLAAIKNNAVTAIKIAQSFTFTESSVDNNQFMTDKEILVPAGVTFTIMSNLNIANKFTNNGTVIVFADNDGKTAFVVDRLEDGKEGSFINNGTFTNLGDTDVFSSFTNNGVLDNKGSICTCDVLGIRDEIIVPLINNITGNGIVSRGAVVLSQTAFEKAYAKMNGQDKYYTDYTFDYNDSISNFDGRYTLQAGDIVIEANHSIEINSTAKVVVPVNSTLTIEEDAFLMINGIFQVEGTVINKGMYNKTSLGQIIGQITTVENGDYGFGFKVSNSEEFYEAVSNNKCYNITLTGDVVVDRDTVINSNLFINEGATLTVQDGKTLTINVRYDKAYHVSYNPIDGTLVNNGTLILNREVDINETGLLDNNGTIEINKDAGICISRDEEGNHATLDNSTGIIKMYGGWLDYEDENGAPREGFIPNPNHVVETFANLSDLAREIWYRENPNRGNTGILSEATVEDRVGYASEFADWDKIDVNDIDGIKAVSMLIKNGIITGTTVEGEKFIYPYDTLSKKDTAVILYKFIQKAIEVKGFEDFDNGAGVTFTDITALTEAEKTAINYLSRAGVLLDNSTEFEPNDLISTVWRNPNGSEIDGGSDICKLVNNIFDKLAVAVVTTEAELIDVMNSDAVQTIKVNGNITLTNNLTITKRVDILQGKSLTVATGKNLTVNSQEQVGYRPENPGFVPGYHGEIFVAGTLSIPATSALYNYTNITVDGGTINNLGSYIDIDGAQGLPDTKYGSLEVESGVLNNGGTFTINSNVRLINTAFTHSENIFTNNGNLDITGGSINVTSEFHNAGYMVIKDIYSSANNNITQINFGSNLTDDSNWIDYTAAVYDEAALYASIAEQDSKILALGEGNRETGLETYSRIDICNNITVNNDITIKNSDIWIEYNEKEQKSVQLVVANKITLKDSTLHVCDSLINNGEICLGTLDINSNPETRGNIQVWPFGNLRNSNAINIVNGSVLRMDNLKPFDGGLTTTRGTIDGFDINSIEDVAIVHNFLGLKTASTSNNPTYERIDIMRYTEENKCDIVLEENLQIDANMYIEWGNGFEVSEGKTLSFTGSDHNINNQGDIWVYGALNLGSGYRLENNSKIQVGGIVGENENTAVLTNNGIIENRNRIEVLENGILTNEGTIYNDAEIVVNGGVFDGSGYVYAGPNSTITGAVTNVILKVYDTQELIDALNSQNITNIMIGGNIDLNDNININKKVFIGYEHENGELKTNGHTITIDENGTLTIYDGRLVINKSEADANGKVVNNGTINVEAKGILRIENGGELVTNSDIDFSEGNLDLYDEDNTGYITGTGNILTYADRAQFIEQAFTILYDFDDNGGNPVVTPSAIGSGHVTYSSAIEAELDGGVREWFDVKEGVDSNIHRRYAYAAMIANGLIASIDELDGSNAPYAKVTYGYAKSVIEEIIIKCEITLNSTHEESINNMFTDLNALIRNNDNSLNQLIEAIKNILREY